MITGIMIEARSHTPGQWNAYVVGNKDKTGKKILFTYHSPEDAAKAAALEAYQKLKPDITLDQIKVKYDMERSRGGKQVFTAVNLVELDDKNIARYERSNAFMRNLEMNNLKVTKHVEIGSGSMSASVVLVEVASPTVWMIDPSGQLARSKSGDFDKAVAETEEGLKHFASKF